MFSLKQYDSIVTRLYDRVSAETLDEMLAAWPAAFRSTGMHSVLMDKRRQLVESSVVAVEAMTGAPHEYERDWRAVDPRLALAVENPGYMFSDVDHIDPAAFERSDLYHAVMRPFDLRYTLFGSVALSNGFVFAPAAMRSRAAGAYRADDVAMMLRLAPHLKRALDLRLELAAANSRAADLAGALDGLTSSVIVLDRCGRVLYLNAAAEAVLNTRDGLVIRDQRLSARTAQACATLSAAVSQTLNYADQPSRPRGATTAPLLVVEVPREGRKPLNVVVHPIRPRLDLRLRAETRARGLVIVHDPEAETRVDRELLEQLHGLTPTEAELAGSLSEGRSLADFAAARGCSVATARTHLKRVLEKTGTHRQAELVHMILAKSALYALRH